MPKNPERLPLIPISTLTQASIESAKHLSKITENLSKVPENESLQKYHSTTKERLDQVTRNIESIQAKSVCDYEYQAIAKEIAYIDSQLFQLVVLDKTLLLGFDKKVNAIPLLDFHRFLSHAFAHEIIRSAHITVNNTIINQLIQVASSLLFVYRDFSGCIAILQCLQMPEVQRIDSVWSQCPPKIIKAFRTLLPILSSDKNYEDYVNTLGSLTLSFIQPDQHPQMVAIPYLYAHLQSIQQVPSTFEILKFCQQRSDIQPFSNKTMQGVIKSADLDRLQSNPSMYHWIVSRPYLSRSQLYHASIQTLPLALDEILDQVDDNDLDLYWEFYRPEIDSLVESTPACSIQDSTSPATELDTISEEPYELVQSPDSTLMNTVRELHSSEYLPQLNLTQSDLSLPIKSESKLSPTAAEFVPTSKPPSSEPEEENEWKGYIEHAKLEAMEKSGWKGYALVKKDCLSDHWDKIEKPTSKLDVGHIQHSYSSHIISKKEHMPSLFASNSTST